MWEQVESVAYNLHPPLLRALGWKKKLKLGPWFGAPLRMLAKMKFLRGTPLDLFGYARSAARGARADRLVSQADREVLSKLTPENLPLALEIAALPDQIRGYEKIKSDNIARVKAQAAEKLARMSEIPVPVLQ